MNEFYKKLDFYNPPATLDKDTFSKTKQQNDVDEIVNNCRLTYAMSPVLATTQFLMQDEFESDESYKIKAKFVNVGYQVHKGIQRIKSSIFKDKIKAESEDKKENTILNAINAQDSVDEFARDACVELMLTDVCYAHTYSVGDKPTSGVEDLSSFYRGMTSIIKRESILSHLTFESKAEGIEQMCICSPHIQDSKKNSLKQEVVQQYIFYVKKDGITKEFIYRFNDKEFVLQDDIKELATFPITKMGENSIPLTSEIAISQIKWMNTGASTGRFVNRLQNPVGIGHGLNDAVLETVRTSGLCSEYEQDTPEWYRCAMSKFAGKSYIGGKMQDGQYSIDFKYVELNGQNYPMQVLHSEKLEKYMFDGFVRIIQNNYGNKSAEESKNESQEAVNFFKSTAQIIEEFIIKIHKKNCAIAGIMDIKADIKMNKEYTEKAIDRVLYEIAQDLLDRTIVNELGFKQIVGKTGVLQEVSEEGFISSKVM